jgi:hypothetical protein
MSLRLFSIGLCCALAVLAQTDTGAVSGVVLDSSGGVVQGARVVLKSPQTGQTYSTATDSVGAFSLLAVKPSIYQLEVSAAGFATTVHRDIVVNVQSRLRFDVTLQPGAVQESILVTAAPPPLESETSSLGQVVENKLVIALPLNGRNYAQLVSLIPGSAPIVASKASQDAFSLNGQRAFQNVYLIDGIDNNNYILGLDTGSAQSLRPSVDAIQEFKVETANYSAEFGRAAGGVISVSLKSGTNEFHGSAFEFLRNNVLDANNFFNNAARLKRPPLRRNQFGGTLGGPVIRDRLFFFTSYQATLIRSNNNITSTVPIPERVEGNFGTTPVYNPFALDGGVRQQFPDNIVPRSLFDPVGYKLARLYPAPNLPGLVNNYAAVVPLSDNDHQGDGRIDYRWNDRNSLFFRGSVNRRETSQGSQFAPPGNGGNGFTDFPLVQTPQSQSVLGSWTSVVTPNQVNELRLGYTQTNSNQLSPGTSPLFAEFGIKGIPELPGLVGLPQISVAGFAALGNRTFTPNPKTAEVLQFIDNYSWGRGNHTLKFGFDARWTANYAASANNARGNLSFNGQFTARVPGQGVGSALADLLLGQTNNAVLSTPLKGDLRNRYYGAFFNDTWRVTRKLTLNLGLRYEFQSPNWEVNNRQGSFDLNPSSATYGSVLAAKGGSLRARTFMNPDRNNFAPRLGFAWTVTQKTVIRAAAGLFYGGLGSQAIGVLGPANPPFFMNVGIPSAGTSPLSVMPLQAGFPPDTLSVTRLANPNAVSLSEHYPMPMVSQWNFSVQRMLPADVVFTAAYVGSSTSHIPAFYDFNDPFPGPGAINPRRPFPQWGTINVNSPWVHATYHSFQAKAERRFSKGFSLLGSYTWSHNIDSSDRWDNASVEQAPANPRNLRAEKSSSSYDIRHRLVVNSIWDLPFRNLSAVRESPWARALLDGWQVAGILTAQTGLPFTPVLGVNPANTTGQARPDRLASGVLPSSQRSIDRWFDVTAFATPAPFTFGNSGRNILRGPGIANLDAMLSRTFRITEQRSFEFRWEMFNALNRAQFGNPVTNLSVAQAATIRSTALPNRQMQLGVRFAF